MPTVNNTVPELIEVLPIALSLAMVIASSISLFSFFLLTVWLGRKR